MKKLIHLSLIISFVSFQNLAAAQVVSGFNRQQHEANEFFVGRELGKPLISINLISGVKHPGVYYVPVGTDMAQLLAYAGGATSEAELESVTLRRQLAKKSEVSCSSNSASR